MAKWKLSVRDLCYAATGSALLAVCAWLSVPFTIPFTLQSFGVCLLAALLGLRRGTLAVLIYLLLGAAGLPVFSGFSGGFQKLAGVTGGYLLGYLPCAFLTGLGAEKAAGRKWFLPALMAAGTLVLYMLGTAWFMAQTGHALGGALSMCVLPFLPGDAAKIAAASLLAAPVRKAVARQAACGQPG